MTELDELRAGGVPDMDAIGRLLAQLAADDEFFAPLIAGMPPESMGVHWLVKPERGPRLVLVHRPEGVMAYTHSHGCWVGIAPVRGAETHQRWNVLSRDSGRAELSPEFADYLYLGLTNATAFSPTDVMPLARWGKLAMTIQAIGSLAVLGLVIARAVNIFK